MASNYDDSVPYEDDDLRTGKLLSRFLNPPPENQPVGMTASAVPPANPAATPAPVASAAPTPTPAAVTNGQPRRSTWADTVRKAQQGAMDALDQSRQASDAIRSQPSVTEASQPVEAGIQKDSTPTPYRDPQTGKVLDSAQQYKPGIGTRILRGVRGAVGGLLEGGPLGAVINSLPKDNPAAKVGTDYSAPNRAYQTAEQQRQSRLTSEQQQLATMLATNKEDTDRLGKLGSEARATATGYGDVAKAATGQQNAETGTRGQGGVDAQMAKIGMKPEMDPNGERTGQYVADPESQAYKMNQAKEDLWSAQQDLAQANADVKRASNDPNSPAYKLAVAKAQTAAQNASAAQERASAYMLNATGRNLGTDTKGNPLPGATQTSEGTPMGSAFQGQYSRSQQNVSRFNDVHGALDSLESATDALAKSGEKPNGALLAAGLAQPKGTFGQWVQGQVSKGNLTPAQRTYITSLVAARENIMALRQSVGGGVSDAQVNRIVEMLPNASTPDLDYAMRQIGQIRSTANRLSEGVPETVGGHKIRTPGNSSHSAPAKPKGVPDGAVWNPQGNDGKGSWQLQSK